MPCCLAVSLYYSIHTLRWNKWSGIGTRSGFIFRSLLLLSLYISRERDVQICLTVKTLCALILSHISFFPHRNAQLCLHHIPYNSMMKEPLKQFEILLQLSKNETFVFQKKRKIAHIGNRMQYNAPRGQLLLLIYIYIDYIYLLLFPAALTIFTYFLPNTHYIRVYHIM